MLARLYQSEDAPALDRFGLGDVRLERDRIVCAGPVGQPVGCLVWRSGGIVHELRTGNGLASRHIADILANFAIGDAVTGQFKLWEAVFVTDSDAMARYAKELGAVEEEGKRVFTLRLR